MGGVCMSPPHRFPLRQSVFFNCLWNINGRKSQSKWCFGFYSFYTLSITVLSMSVILTLWWWNRNAPSSVDWSEWPGEVNAWFLYTCVCVCVCVCAWPHTHIYTQAPHNAHTQTQFLRLAQHNSHTHSLAPMEVVGVSIERVEERGVYPVSG